MKLKGRGELYWNILSFKCKNSFNYTIIFFTINFFMAVKRWESYCFKGITDLVFQYVTYLVGHILNTRPRIWVSCRLQSETSSTSKTRCSAGSWGHGWPCVSAATTRRPRKASSLTETGEWGSDVDWGRGGRLVDQLTFRTVLQQI